MITFTVPGEPIGRTFTPAKTESYEARVASYAEQRMCGETPFEGPLRMTIRADYLVPASWSKKKAAVAFWKSSKPDADNIAKIVKDALNKIVYRDDAQIAELIVQKRYAPIAGLAVTVEKIAAGQLL